MVLRAAPRGVRKCRAAPARVQLARRALHKHSHNTCDSVNIHTHSFTITKHILSYNYWLTNVY